MARPAYHGRLRSQRHARNHDRPHHYTRSTSAPAQPGPAVLGLHRLALQGFGGVLAVVQRELVERRRWLTNDEFIEDWAVAQILPGPNVVNLSIMVGDRYFGLRGALVAVAGMLLLPMLLLLAVATLYAAFASHP
jgi:chromate transporter